MLEYTAFHKRMLQSDYILSSTSVANVTTLKNMYVVSHGKSGRRLAVESSSL